MSPDSTDRNARVAAVFSAAGLALSATGGVFAIGWLYVYGALVCEGGPLLPWAVRGIVLGLIGAAMGAPIATAAIIHARTMAAWAGPLGTTVLATVLLLLRYNFEFAIRGPDCLAFCT